jgi:hypothetical protein
MIVVPTAAVFRTPRVLIMCSWPVRTRAHRNQHGRAFVAPSHPGDQRDMPADGDHGRGYAKRWHPNQNRTANRTGKRRQMGRPKDDRRRQGRPVAGAAAKSLIRAGVTAYGPSVGYEWRRAARSEFLRRGSTAIPPSRFLTIIGACWGLPCLQFRSRFPNTIFLYRGRCGQRCHAHRPDAGDHHAPGGCVVNSVPGLQKSPVTSQDPPKSIISTVLGHDFDAPARGRVA